MKQARFGLAVVGATLITSMWVAGARSDADGTWSTLCVTPGSAPEARKHHTMVYDPGNNRVILYGGEDATQVFDDLWVLDLLSLTWTEHSPSGGPGPLHGHSAAFDPGSGAMYVLTGLDDSNEPVDGVWKLGSDLTWSTVLSSFPTTLEYACAPAATGCGRAFAKRSHSAAACITGTVYLMGGRDGFIAKHDVWKLVNGSWGYVSGALVGLSGPCDTCIDYNIPDFRYWHSMIADGFGRLVVFGGHYDTIEADPSNVFTSADGGVTWNFLGNAPTGSHDFNREFHAAVFDSERNRMVVVGGYNNGGNDATDAVTSLSLPATLPSFSNEDLSEVNEDWVLHTPAGASIGAIAEHAAVYDSQHDRIIVFGGVSSDHYETQVYRSTDVWALDFGSIPPAAATLVAGDVGRYSSTITWTAPGDNGWTGRACEYDLRRSTATITEGNFSAATRLTTDAPQSAGNSECAATGPNSQCLTYYYALKTRDDTGNWSAMSNVLSVTQKCSGISYICENGLGPVSAVSPFPAMVEYAIRSANPASGSTRLFIGVPEDREGESMELSIYDVTGARVRTLTQQAARAGDLELTWDHRNESGVGVAAGIYFARLTLGNEARTHKIVIPKGR